tara:strand:+ start:80 stop:556 length:477 start_codon:yes stop_codon:yes gene_type:complete
MNITIKRAKYKDIPLVANVVLETFLEEIHNGNDQLESTASKEKFIEMYKQRIQRNVPTIIYIAEQDGEIIGVAGGSVSTHIWSYTSKWGTEDFWFVKKQYRGSKAGAMLFDKLINWFKKAGANRIMMTHYTWNPSIEKYYIKKGFVPFETNYVYKVGE